MQQVMQDLCEKGFKKARPAGLEPATPGSEGKPFLFWGAMRYRVKSCNDGACVMQQLASTCQRFLDFTRIGLKIKEFSTEFCTEKRALVLNTFG